MSAISLYFTNAPEDQTPYWTLCDDEGKLTSLSQLKLSLQIMRLNPLGEYILTMGYRWKCIAGLIGGIEVTDLTDEARVALTLAINEDVMLLG